MTAIGFIGFGEAGSLLAGGLREDGADIVGAYDILVERPDAADALSARAEAVGVRLTAGRGAAVTGAEIIISAVTCDQTVKAATAVAPHLGRGQIYFDINSTSPKAKREAAAVVEKSGAAFVEAAVMDLVPPHGHHVPMLLAGPRAADAARLLSAHNMQLQVVGETIGDASAIKMVRSVFMKGLSAVLLECLYAASKLDAEDFVLESLQVTYPQFDWRQFADRNLLRLVQHAKRQADEMIDAAETLEELGIEPLTATASAKRLGWLAGRALLDLPEPRRKTAADVLRLLRHDTEPA